MKVLVIGGEGYLGRVLCNYLKNSCDHEVSVYDCHKHQKHLGHKSDIRNIERLSPHIERADAVILLAAVVGEGSCDKHSLEALQTNVFATKAVAGICKYYGKKLVFASTDSVYGIQEGKVTEETTPKPISWYAESKLLAEDYILSLADDDFKPVILRMGTLFGLSSRMRFDLVINQMTRDAICKGEITVYGGDQWRPFLHLLDASKAYSMALNFDDSGIYNVGSPDLNLQIKDISKQLLLCFPILEVKKIKQDPDLRDYWVVTEKLYSKGFKAEISLEMGIEEIQIAMKHIFESPYEAKYSND